MGSTNRMGSTKKLAATLAGAAALAVAWSLGHAAGHKDHGSMVALDEVERAPARPGSPVGIAVLAGDPATGAHVRLVKLPAGYVAPRRARAGDYRGVSQTGTWRRSFLETGESRERLPGGPTSSSRAARCTATPASATSIACRCSRNRSRRISFRGNSGSRAGGWRLGCVATVRANSASASAGAWTARRARHVGQAPCG